MDRNVWRILLVEDDQEDYFLVQMMLSDTSRVKFSLEWASSYDMGRQLLFNADPNTAPYDAVLVDYELGQHKGVELIREAAAWGYPAPMLLMTGHGSYEVDVDAMSAGAYDYLNKGEINPGVLERAIRYAIERKKNEEALQREIADRKRAEAAVDLERQRLALAQEAGGLGSFDWDLTNGRIHWSPELEALYGFALGENDGSQESARLAILPEDRKRVGEANEAGVRDGAYETEFRIRHRQSGEIRWLYARGKVLYNDQGQPVRLIGINMDITKRKMAEQALKESRKEIAGILESINDGFFAFDREWRYTYINRRAAEPLGYQPEDLIGKNLWELFPKMRGTIAEMHYRRAMEEGIPSKYRVQGVYSERWYDISVYPSQNGIAVYSVDRTDEVEAEMALRKSEERFRVALSNASIAVFSTDRDLRYDWFYTSAMGSIYEQFIGKRDDEILPPEYAAEIIAIKQMALDRETVVVKETTIYTQEKPVIVILSVEPYYDAEGALLGVIGAAVDVTEQRRLQAENLEHATQMEVQRRLLEYREKERQEIARDLHDGPVQDLSSLIFNVQFAKEALPDPGTRVELEQIGLGLKDVVHDLRSMINELRPPSLIRFGLAKAMQLHIQDFKEKHPEIAVDSSLMDDGNCLTEQLRLNLFRIQQEALNNAANHADATRIAIRFECSNREAALTVADNGKGFLVSPNLFDYTLHGHFGLAGMKERAEALSGCYQLESEPGKGTTIRVVVPTTASSSMQ